MKISIFLQLSFCVTAAFGRAVQKGESYIVNPGPKPKVDPLDYEDDIKTLGNDQVSYICYFMYS